MSKVKTALNDGNVNQFIDSIAHPQRKEDSVFLLQLMKEITGLEPKMWGTSIVGFGSYHYRYESGREGDWFVTGFSPRKQSMTIYIMPGFRQYDKLMQQLGKHKTGKSCLYINKLTDVNHVVLRELVAQSVEYMNQKYNKR